jgi:hypothetical protein
LFCAQCGNALATPTITPSATPIEQQAGDAERARMTSQRPPSAAPGAMAGRMKPGVDKLRRVSSVVLDEAAYDPSVRFILVVGFLFLLFLVLLLLSKWIG